MNASGFDLLSSVVSVFGSTTSEMSMSLAVEKELSYMRRVVLGAISSDRLTSGIVY